MKKRIYVIFIFSTLLCISCSGKLKMKTLLDFNAEDVTSVTITTMTGEDSEILDVRDTGGIQDFKDLLSKVNISRKMIDIPLDATYFYLYRFNLSDGNIIAFFDYQDYLKVVTEEEEDWYEISTNTWDGLDDLWQKYYVEPNDYQYNQYNQDNQDNITIFKPDISSDVKYKKPVIYLYPKEPTEVSIELDFDGRLTYTYPEYKEGWKVLANPDGTLKNLEDGKTFSYLFWEGDADHEFDLSEGFVVKGSDTTSFLEEKLAYLGLTSEEYNDFIVYWAPQMSANPYNLITFQQEAYTDLAELNITPEPDSILRVFMVYQPLQEYIMIPEQELTQWTREGFAVVEWGGSVTP